MILKSLPKSCELDPMPISLFFECIDEVVTAITHVVNESFLSGTFPSMFKTAIVKPLPKKPSLDQDDLINYRPVSNLSFLSKVAEKLVLSQLSELPFCTHSIGCQWRLEFSTKYPPSVTVLCQIPVLNIRPGSCGFIHHRDNSVRPVTTAFFVFPPSNQKPLVKGLFHMLVL